MWGPPLTKRKAWASCRAGPQPRGRPRTYLPTVIESSLSSSLWNPVLIGTHQTLISLRRWLAAMRCTK